MEIPVSRFPRDFGSPLPSISQNDGFRGPMAMGFSRRSSTFDDNNLSTSRPMSIRGLDNRIDAPPPLPPPRVVPGLGGPMGHNPEFKDYHQHHQHRDVDGSPADPWDHMSFGRKERPFRDTIDEGYQSIDTARSPGDFHSSFGMHSMKSFRPNGDAIDRSMVNRLDGRRRQDNGSPPRFSGLSSSTGDIPPKRALHGQLTQLSLPHRTKFFESSNGFTKSPIAMSAASPLSNPFLHSAANSADYRSPIAMDSDFERSPLPRSRRTNSGSVADDMTVSTQGSVDMSREDDVDFPMDSETSRMRSLNIDDPWRERERERELYQTAGQKRRASSPPGDDYPLASDLVRRRDGSILSRGSPTPRLQVPHGSISSVSSGRSGSYVSTMTASSTATMGSFGRRSPIPLSPVGLSPTETVGSPFATPISLTTSPRSSISRGMPGPQPHVSIQQPHSRALTEHNRALASPRKFAEISKSGNGCVSKLKEAFMCQCCPKKPKKFDTEDELNAHAAEKQYECSYCGSRFKNKNEAERHQNSLHVRRHSWSCSALTGYERAFHDSPSRPGDADTCGYCGEEFNRTGASAGPGQSGRFISEQDWEERIHHLQDVHKFRECNSSKKFYRADHFRQHLKHSHAGTSGKWTNMLENACMIEEEPPVMGAR